MGRVKITTKKATKPTFEKISDVHNLYRYRGNNLYYGIVRHKGKLHKKSLATEDKATAKRKLADWERDLGKVDPSQGRLTLRELCSLYLGTIASQAADTVSLKTTIVKRLLADLPVGADAQVSKVKPSDLSVWLNSYEFGYSSYNHYLQVIKAIFAIAVADKAIVASPAAELTGKKVVTPIRTTPSFDEFNAIIADVRKQKWNAEANDSADYLEFMGLVGVGQAEASGLQKQHVNLTTKQLTFFRVKTRTPYTVPMFGQAEALIKKLVGKPGMKPTDAFFPITAHKSKNNAGSCSKNAGKALSSACARLKLPDYTQRSLRRMFITRCIEKGIDVKVVAQWQGHRDGGKLILGTYSHVRNTHAEDMAKLLD